MAVGDFLKPCEDSWDYDSGIGGISEQMAYGTAWRDWRDRVDAQPDNIRRMLEHENRVVRGVGAVAATLFGVELPPEAKAEF